MPSWIENPPKDDNKFIYSLGKYVDENLSDAFKNSKNRAIQKMEEKIIKFINEELKNWEQSYDISTIVKNSVKNESTFKEFFIMNKGLYETYTLAIYPKERVNNIFFRILIESEFEDRQKTYEILKQIK